jgi:two-component system response regulator AtoC
VNQILIIDDDQSIREILTLHLEERGFEVISADSAEEGERLAAQSSPVAVVLDVRLPDRSGLELVAGLRQLTNAPVLMITAFHDMATTILAMKAGAFDYIQKPIDIRVFDSALDRALEERRVSSSDQTLHLSGIPSPGLHDIVGRSPRMQEIFKEVGKVASSGASVLVSGESGTGKELIARVIHQYSAPTRPFVAVNCATLIESLLESELFGHERGSFTGAIATKVGKCELAEDGTLFLDEIGDLSPGLQAKMLRVLQEREFERVGGVKKIQLRARIIAATHRDLEERVITGAFRNDLYQRLRVVTLDLPALRERVEDIPLLVEHLLARINARVGRQVLKVPREVMSELQSRSWPGNVRELENILTRAVVMAPGDVLLPKLIRSATTEELRINRPVEEPASVTRISSVLPGPTGIAPPEKLPTLDEVEKEHILRVLQVTQGHRGRTCDMLGITRPTLERKLRKYGIDIPRRSGSDT